MVRRQAARVGAPVPTPEAVRAVRPVVERPVGLVPGDVDPEPADHQGSAARSTTKGSTDTQADDSAGKDDPGQDDEVTRRSHGSETSGSVEKKIIKRTWAAP